MHRTLATFRNGDENADERMGVLGLVVETLSTSCNVTFRWREIDSAPDSFRIRPLNPAADLIS